MIEILKNCKIRSDSMGDGHYLASRGNRLHRGVDYIVKPYEEVYAPLNGRIVRIAYPYSNDLTYKGILFQAPNIALKIFYFSPIKSLLGKEVKAGQTIGYAQDISKKYGKDMIPHIHVEVTDLNIDLLMGKL